MLRLFSHVNTTWRFTLSFYTHYFCKLATIPLLALPALSAQADDTPISEEPVIIITPGRVYQTLESSPTFTQQYTIDPLLAATQNDIGELLSQLPLNVVSMGNTGQQTSIFLRGSNSNHVALLVDGAVFNSPTNGIANIQNISTAGLNTVEVSSGPASVLYGSNAIGGVIQLSSTTPKHNMFNVTTVQDDQHLQHTRLNGAFTQNNWYATASTDWLNNTSSPIVSTSPLTTDYARDSYFVKLGYQQEDTHVNVFSRQNKGNSAYLSQAYDDNYMPIGFQAYHQQFNNRINGLNAESAVTDTLQYVLHATHIKESLQQLESNDFNAATRLQFDNLLHAQFTPQTRFSLGHSLEKVEADILSYGKAYAEKNSTHAVFTQLQYNTNALNMQTGYRVVDNPTWGTHHVWQTAARYTLPSASVYANIGTAFNAPTLDQRFGWGGNATLQPEHSQSAEMGLHIPYATGSSVQLSTYRTKSDNLITFNAQYALENIDTALSRGAQLQLKQRLFDNTLLQVSYEYNHAQNTTTQQRLLRRPLHLASAQATVNLLPNVNVQCGLRYKGSALDAGNTIRAAFTVADAVVQWDVRPIKLLLSVQNIANTHYATSTTKNYAYLGDERRVQLGVSYTFK